MIKFDWKILDLDAKNGIITSAKYFCRAEDEGVVVETEGNWYFKDPQGEKTPYDKVTEKQVIEWINSEAIRDGKNLITSRLEEQVVAQKTQKLVVPPCLPQTFTIKI